VIDTRGLLTGLSSATGEVTLTAGTTTTTVTHIGVSTKSCVVLMAKTASAGNEWPYYITPNKNEFTITHLNDAATDRTFAYSFTTPIGR
jgi:hypothetical protein